MIKQFLTFSYGSWVSAAISFLTTPVITLLIVPEEFGKAAMFALAISCVSTVGVLGMDQSFIRMFYEKAEDERPALLWRCFAFAMAMTALIVCALLPFWRQISTALFEEPDFSAMLLLVGCLLLSVINRFATNVIRMKKRGNVLSLSQIICVTVHLAVVIVYALYAASTFHAIVWGTLFSVAASVLVNILPERKFWGARVHKALFGRDDSKQVLSYGVPLVPVLIMTFLFQAMDKIALRAYSSLDEIGLYAVANKFVFLLTIIYVSFSLFWSPVAFERYEKNNNDFRFFEKMFKTLAAAVLIAAGGMLLAKDVIVLLLAPPYRSAVMIMPFMIFVPMMHLLADITGMGIGLKKKTYLHIVVVAAAALVNFAGNYYLIPVLGARGAAISTGIAYVTYFALRTWISGRLFPAHYRITPFVPSLLLLTAFMYLNTFHVVPWWYNAAPATVAALLHRRIIAEFLRESIREVRGQ